MINFNYYTATWDTRIETAYFIHLADAMAYAFKNGECVYRVCSNQRVY